MPHNRFFTNALTYSSAVAAIAALAFYCVIRIAFSIFYIHFGLSYQDVGGGFQDVLLEQASGINVALAVIVTGVVLRACWLLTTAGTHEQRLSERIREIGTEKSLISTAAIAAVGDRAEESRRVAALELRKNDLADQLPGAKATDLRLRRRGYRWLAAGLALFFTWSALLLSEAALAGAQPRQAEWFDALQLDIPRVIAVVDAHGAPYPPAAGPGELLLMGEDSGDFVLYDKRTARLELVPIANVTVRLASS